MSYKWVCNIDKSHIFEEPTDDYFCDKEHDMGEIGILFYEPVLPPPIEGIEVGIVSPTKKSESFEDGSSVTITAEARAGSVNISKVTFFDNEKQVGEVYAPPYSYTYQVAGKGTHSLTVKAWDDDGRSELSEAIDITVTPKVTPEVGLCVILMDASNSMADAAFANSPVSKMRLVAKTAANGIFDLQRMQNNPHAFIALYKFDDRVELMCMETVDKLINRFDKDEKKFENYLYDELSKFMQGTDINQALMHAHSFVDKFLRNQLPDFPLKKYRPMTQVVYGSNGSVSIPNIRVLIYTDGKQFTSRDKTLRQNPFIQNPLQGLNHDIVIGAFFGNEDDEGCQELKSILSNCPVHDELQFFLFDNPAKIGGLRYLFRMASGASGFCPKDLEKELTRF